MQFWLWSTVALVAIAAALWGFCGFPNWNPNQRGLLFLMSYFVLMGTGGVYLLANLIYLAVWLWSKR